MEKRSKPALTPAQQVAFYGVFTALALLLGYVESLIALPLPVPGAKLGLPNLVILLALYLLGPKAAGGLTVLRVVLSALLFSGFSAFWFSLAGAILSFLVMSLAWRIPRLGVVGVSVLGGVFHNLGQLIVAGLVIENLSILGFLPLLMVFGVIAGALLGVIAAACLPRLQRLIH